MAHSPKRSPEPPRSPWRHSVNRCVEWPGVKSPSTFVVCTEDRAIPVDGPRRHAAKATRTIELACGHHPFLSQPEALAQITADSTARSQ